VSRTFGRYRLDALLGRGGFGEVWRAHDTDLDRAVALKLLSMELSADSAYRDRFVREARMAARLRDPHVVPVHGQGEVGGRLYLEMRLVDGPDLQTELRRLGRLDPQQAVAVVEQVAEALDSAHDEGGLVHRDVKPANIMLARAFAAPGTTPFVYLADFGIARDLNSATVTRSGVVIGTWAYMAPERFEGDRGDRRVDVYALACVLYECLTGERPFPFETQAALVGAHLSKPPPRPSERVAVSQALDAVVATGMAKDPQQRYGSAADLASAARRALVARAQTTEAARPAWPPPPVVPPTHHTVGNGPIPPPSTAVDVGRRPGPSRTTSRARPRRSASGELFGDDLSDAAFRGMRWLVVAFLVGMPLVLVLVLTAGR
jgi:serine/threonine protein kinase